MTIWLFHRGMVVIMELWIFSTGLVVVLDEPHLRGGLDRDHPRELEVVELLLEAYEEGLEVAELLGIHGIAGGLRLRLELGEGGGPRGIGRPDLPRGQEEVELVEVVDVLLVELVQHRDVFEGRRIVQIVDDLVDLGIELGVAGHETLGRVDQAREDTLMIGGEAPDIDLLDLEDQRR